jgi:hypothetical protein
LFSLGHGWALAIEHLKKRGVAHYRYLKDPDSVDFWVENWEQLRKVGKEEVEPVPDAKYVFVFSHSFSSFFQTSIPQETTFAQFLEHALGPNPPWL